MPEGEEQPMGADVILQEPPKGPSVPVENGSKGSRDEERQ